MGHEPSNLPLVYPARRGAEAASAPRGVRGSYGSPLSFCSLLCRKRLKKKNNVLDYERQDLNLYPAPYQGVTIPFKLLSHGDRRARSAPRGSPCLKAGLWLFFPVNPYLNALGVEDVSFRYSVNRIRRRPFRDLEQNS